MKYSKRTIILSILIISILSLQTIALVVDAVAPGTARYVRGYVKKSGTTTPISGATVQIWNDWVYLGQVTTTSAGYFSFSTTREPTMIEYGWKVTITKSGYVTTTRYAEPVDYVTNMGTIYMSPPSPPTAPVISNVAATAGGIGEIIISWAVDWDDSSTGYSSKCWWSTDSTMDSGDLFFSTTAKQSSYSVTVPEDRVLLSGGTYYYQIYAMNSKNGYYPATYYGPASVVLDEVWIVAPTDDAYTVEYPLDSQDNTFNTDRLSVHEQNNHRVWIKFEVPNSAAISKATLYLFHEYYDEEVGGHGIVRAFQSESTWNEETITFLNQPAIGTLQLDQNDGYIPPPYTAMYLEWDVTAIQSESDEISITLLIPFAAHSQGAEYYSKEAVDHRPYLQVEYMNVASEVDPELVPFEGCTFARDTLPDGWQVSNTNPAPWFSYETGLSDTAGVDYEDGGWLEWLAAHHAATTDYVGQNLEVDNFEIVGASSNRCLQKCFNPDSAKCLASLNMQM